MLHTIRHTYTEAWAIDRYTTTFRGRQTNVEKFPGKRRGQGYVEENLYLPPCRYGGLFGENSIGKVKGAAQHYP